MGAAAEEEGEAEEEAEEEVAGGAGAVGCEAVPTRRGEAVGRLLARGGGMKSVSSQLQV